LIDAVLMYAQRGHGKRSSFYSDYTFGVWTHDDAGARVLTPSARPYFGFTDDELKQIDKYVRDHTIERFGPVRSVRAEPHAGLVFEVAFEGLQRSTRHKSGIAMRFPTHQPHPLGQAPRRGRRARDPGANADADGGPLKRVSGAGRRSCCRRGRADRPVELAERAFAYGPGGSSMETPPLATPAACQASACSGEAHAKPIVGALALLAGSPSIGSDTANTPGLRPVEPPGGGRTAARRHAGGVPSTRRRRPWLCPGRWSRP